MTKVATTACSRGYMSIDTVISYEYRHDTGYYTACSHMLIQAHTGYPGMLQLSLSITRLEHAIPSWSYLIAVACMLWSMLCIGSCCMVWYCMYCIIAYDVYAMITHSGGRHQQQLVMVSSAVKYSSDEYCSMTSIRDGVQEDIVYQ